MYHISTNDCHVYYIYHIARLHRNCCEKKDDFLEYGVVYLQTSLAFLSLPRVVQQWHLSVQRNADFVVCCQPAIFCPERPLPHTFWKAQLKDLRLACVMPAWRRTYIHIEIRCAYSYTRILNSRTCNNCTMIHVTNSIHYKYNQTCIINRKSLACVSIYAFHQGQLYYFIPHYYILYDSIPY